jgi:hypothetical protein
MEKGHQKKEKIRISVYWGVSSLCIFSSLLLIKISI